jgi:hypothetical protein
MILFEQGALWLPRVREASVGPPCGGLTFACPRPTVAAINGHAYAGGLITTNEAVAWIALRLLNSSGLRVLRNAPCGRRRWPQSTPQRGSIEIGYRMACQIPRAHARTRCATASRKWRG